ncbi:hypothetical protein DFH09DRAFT_234708 [Mycena vulgaris]|nr:hypothetical protein DFH09DRAFT_234708 [Mycena vulgaris]
MVEEAIANGTWVPPAPRVKVDPKKKPRLWDAYLAPPVNVPVGSGGEVEGEREKDEWEAIMPFAASYTPPSHAPPPSTASLPSASTPTPSPAHPPASANALNGKAAEQEEIGLEQPRVRVAVLIAMPIPPPSSASSSNSHQLSPPTPHTPSSPQAAGGRTSEPQRPTWAWGWTRTASRCCRGSRWGSWAWAWALCRLRRARMSISYPTAWAVGARGTWYLAHECPLALTPPQKFVSRICEVLDENAAELVRLRRGRHS